MNKKMSRMKTGKLKMRTATIKRNFIVSKSNKSEILLNATNMAITSTLTAQQKKCGSDKKII